MPRETCSYPYRIETAPQVCDTHKHPQAVEPSVNRPEQPPTRLTSRVVGLRRPLGDVERHLLDALSENEAQRAPLRCATEPESDLSPFRMP